MASKTADNDKRAKFLRAKHDRSAHVKLDDALIEFFCEWIERGHPLDWACGACAIPQWLVTEWMDKAETYDKEGIERYAIHKRFKDETRAAVYRHLADQYSKYQKYPPGEWQKYQWILATRDRRNFGRDGMGDSNAGTGSSADNDKFI